MKGVVLAGGTGSRLNPLTKVTKHSIYCRCMTSRWCITRSRRLVNAGIHEILLVTGGKNAADFLRLLGNGHDFGLKASSTTLTRKVRAASRRPSFGRALRRQCPSGVILGDTLIEHNICGGREKVQAIKAQEPRVIFERRLRMPSAFGVAEVSDNPVIRIEGKAEIRQSPTRGS